MNYVVIKTQQIAVEAANPEDAFKQVAGGGGTVISASMSANPRPDRPQTQGGTGAPTQPNPNPQ